MIHHHCLALGTSQKSFERVSRWAEALALCVRWVHSEVELRSLAARGASSNAISMIIVDVPDASHLPSCCTLKQDLSTASIPVVALAADSRLSVAAYESGVEVVLLPRVGQALALARIRSLLRHAGSTALCEPPVSLERMPDVLVRSMLYRYVSPQIVDRALHVAASGEPLHGGTRAHVAVLFADMRGFTGVAEQLPATHVFELLNEFFGTLTAIAFRHEGTVFNMAGDSLMVGFGAPVPQASTGMKAVRAAREMLMAFSELASRWEKRYGVYTGLGIGINEGEVIAGNVGSDEHMSYTLIGDTVNVAARLSQRARAGEVLFSTALQVSLEECGDAAVPVKALPPLVLRGRSTPVSIYCVPTKRRVTAHH